MYRLNDRNRAIGEMFSGIAPRYDLLNRLLSAGIDRRWRRAAVAEMTPAAGGRHLDRATGTADMALEIFRQKGSAPSVAAVDLSEEMMRIGRGKCIKAGRADDLYFVRAPASRSRSGTPRSIPPASPSHPQRRGAELGLAEMCRVVRPGGRVVVLEFSVPEGGVLGVLYRFYFTRILPWIADRLRRAGRRTGTSPTRCCRSRSRRSSSG
jgi:demethylmenaquinone methyltransferase/2-methoxy-6-polyprenyl-1,4-benzoquinol methylase